MMIRQLVVVLQTKFVYRSLQSRKIDQHGPGLPQMDCQLHRLWKGPQRCTLATWQGRGEGRVAGFCFVCAIKPVYMAQHVS